jgi:hypothetical protein
MMICAARRWTLSIAVVMQVSSITMTLSGSMPCGASVQHLGDNHGSVQLAKG